MIELIDYGFGPAARNRLAEAADPTEDGAVAALETFYFALNRRDIEVMSSVWSSDGLAQLNNPLGGILRGGEQAVALYRRIFAKGLHLQVTFGDAVSYLYPGTAVFAGRETGTYAAAGQAPGALEIRTTRFFRHDERVGRWVQLHHHGSIDQPAALAAYQRAAAAS
jgi:SnoaL-like domain